MLLALWQSQEQSQQLSLAEINTDLQDLQCSNLPRVPDMGTSAKVN